MPKAKVVKLTLVHAHRGAFRTVHVGFAMRVCDGVPLDFCRRAVQALLESVGASAHAIKSVTVAAVPPSPPTRSASRISTGSASPSAS